MITSFVFTLNRNDINYATIPGARRATVVLHEIIISNNAIVLCVSFLAQTNAWLLNDRLMTRARADCYSGIEDMECQNNNASTIFYNKTCMAIGTVCSSFGYNSKDGNITHCFHKEDDNNATALRDLYTRVLSSEEYFR